MYSIDSKEIRRMASELTLPSERGHYTQSTVLNRNRRHQKHELGRLLIIDKESADDPNFQDAKFLQFVLECLGFQSDLAQSLQQTISFLNDNKYTGIIVDYKKYSTGFEDFATTLNSLWVECLELKLQNQTTIPLISYSKTEPDLEFKIEYDHLSLMSFWRKGSSLARLCEGICNDLVIKNRTKFNRNLTWKE